MNTIPELPFTKNWNGKLFLDNFSTVRLYNPSKYFIGNEMEVTLKGISYGYAKVVAVRAFKYNQISDLLSFTDTGFPAYYLGGLIKKFYSKKIDLTPDTLLHHVVMHYTRRNLENQSAALQDWWQDVRNEFATN